MSETTGHRAPTPRTARRERAGRLLLVLLFALATAAALLGGGCRSAREWYLRRQTRAPYRVVRAPIAYEITRDSSGILILDLRTQQEFMGALGHLRNAVNIPLARLPYRLIEIGSFRGETFLVYCDTEPCAEAGMAVLLSSGFTNGILIEGGIDAWVRYGFKTFLPAASVGRVRPERVPGLTPDQPKELPVVPPPAAPPPR